MNNQIVIGKYKAHGLEINECDIKVKQTKLIKEENLGHRINISIVISASTNMSTCFVRVDSY